MGETAVALREGRPGGPARTAAPPTFKPALAVVAAGLAFAAMVWAGLFFHVRERERSAFAGAGRDASNIALALEGQVERTIVGLDQVLRFAQGEIADKGTALDLRVFAKRLTALGGVSHQIGVADAAGNLVGTSLDPPSAKPVNVADREHFQVHRDGADAGLFISRPVLGRASGRWSIQLSRRLDGRDGSFAGIVVISLDPDYLSQQFAGLDVGPDGAVTLFGRDGFVRVRSPQMPGLYEGDRTTRPRKPPPAACSDLQPGRTVTCRFESPLDGLDRIYAYRLLGSLPLIVSVGVSTAAIEAALAPERRRAFWLGVSVSLTLVGAFWLLLRELERRRRREVELRRSEATCRDKSEQLQATLDNMDQGLLVVDADGRVPVCNRRAMALLDLPPEMMASTPDFAEVMRLQAERNEFAGAGGAVRTWIAGGDLGPDFDVHRRVRPNGIALEIRTVPLPGGGAVRTYTDITAARMAEEDLRAAKDFAESLLRASPDCIKVLDLQGRLTFINAAGRCLLELDELRGVDGLSFAELFPAGSRDLVAAAVRRALGGDGSRFAAFCPTAKGTPKWWDISVAPVRGRGGAVDKLLVVSRDMTDRREAEQAVRDSEARLQAALDAGRMYAWERDPASGFVARSPNAASVLGLSTGETWTASDTFDSFLSHVHPDDRDRLEAETAAALDRGAPYAVEFRWTRPDDGRVIWLSDVGRRIRDPLTGCERFLGLCSDVTRRKAAEEALADSEARYRLLADNVSDLIVLCGADGRRSYISPAVTPMLGYTAEEARRLPLREGVHPDDLPAVLAVTRGLTAAEPRGNVVYRLKRRNGGFIWAEAAFQRLVDGTTGEVKVLAAIRDVSERQAQENALREAKDAAEAASEAKTEFLASMSHEIRTPLNGILGYADLLLDDPALGENQRRHLRRIQTAGSALLTVVNDVLDLSKIEAGQVELEPQPFSLAALVDNTVSITRGLADRKGLALRVEIDSGLPAQAVGDQDRLRQVLLNLLNNAIKFTQAGSVTLRLAEEAGAPDDRCRIRFSVADTGIGIPGNRIGHLFQRFSQIDGSSRREFGGTGLGLAISKHLVEMMGGTIGVESEHLRGATFWFSVPFPRGFAAGEAPGPALPRPAGKAARLLLVEDLDINQELACAVLTAAGHAVDVVSDGADAVMAVQAKAYDLVLMDIQMPGMDGITATRHIRALQHPAAEVPIVAMTANVLPQQVAQFRLAGMNGHVGKPFKRDELLHAIQRSLSPSEPACAAPAEPPSALDGAAFADLEAMLGREKVHGLLGGLQDRLAAFLPDGAGADDPGELAREAHRLVSVAGMLGFRRMSELCSALEAACGAGGELGAILPEVRAARARALHEIRALREAA